MRSGIAKRGAFAGIVAVLVLAGCSTLASTLLTPTSSPSATASSAPQLLFSDVACAPGSGSAATPAWTVADATTRAEILGLSSLSGKQTVFRDDYFATGPQTPLIVLADGSRIDSEEAMFDFACAQHPEDALADAINALFLGGGAWPSCTGFTQATVEQRAPWLLVLNRYSGTSSSDADVSRVCEHFADTDLVKAVGSTTQYLEQIRKLAFSWQGGPVSFSDYDGYTASATFSGELGGFSSDVTNAPPGYTDVAFTLSMSLTWVNTTPSRNNSSLFFVGVSPVWPESSDVCRLLFDHMKFWGNIAPDFLWNTGPYCLPQIELGPLEYELAPGASTTNSTTATFSKQILETDLPAIRQALTVDGAPMWIAYVGNTSSGNINYDSVVHSRGCSVWNGAFHFPILGISTNAELPDCPLSIQ